MLTAWEKNTANTGLIENFNVRTKRMPEEKIFKELDPNLWDKLEAIGEVCSLPMMMGEGPFGPVEMGGMFTVIKVRDNVAQGDYSDPGWYEHPPGTVAWKVADGGPERKARRS